MSLVRRIPFGSKIIKQDNDDDFRFLTEMLQERAKRGRAPLAFAVLVTVDEMSFYKGGGGEWRILGVDDADVDLRLRCIRHVDDLNHLWIEEYEGRGES